MNEDKSEKLIDLLSLPPDELGKEIKKLPKKQFAEIEMTADDLAKGISSVIETGIEDIAVPCLVRIWQRNQRTVKEISNSYSVLKLKWLKNDWQISAIDRL